MVSVKKLHRDNVKKQIFPLTYVINISASFFHENITLLQSIFFTSVFALKHSYQNWQTADCFIIGCEIEKKDL